MLSQIKIEDIIDLLKMENVSQIIAKLKSSNSSQIELAKQQINTMISTNPRNFLVELQRICLDLSETESTVSKAAELIKKRFWK